MGGAQKLPVMYLIDSIMKNVGREYIKLFGHNIISIFCNVFEKVRIFIAFSITYRLVMFSILPTPSSATVFYKYETVW